MAGAAEAVGDGVTAFDLAGCCRDLDVRSRGTAAVQPDQPIDHEGARHQNSDRQQTCQTAAAPLENRILDAQSVHPALRNQSAHSNQPPSPTPLNTCISPN